MRRTLLTLALAALTVGCSNTGATSSTSGGATSGSSSTSSTSTSSTSATASSSSGATTTGAGTTGSTNGGTSSGTTRGRVDGGIPATFFGMHVNHLAGLPTQVPFGYFREWDGAGGQWKQLETCNPAGDGGTPHFDGGCFDWTTFDTVMTILKDGGVDESLFTLSITPEWAWPDGGPSPVPCDYGGQTCYPPRDLNGDGSGPDLIWINWVTGLAQHVNAPGYADTHSHIHLYEPWNEFYRSDILSGTLWTTNSFFGTYAQMVRMTEDLRCVVKGVGTIHNTPTAGQAMTCSQLLTQLGRAAIDPSALIVTPSGNFQPKGSEKVGALLNFLYCNDSPKQDAGCTTGDAGSAAVDVIDFHYYPSDSTPEAATVSWIADDKTALSTADLAKPLIAGEGSWGPVVSPATATTGSIWELDAYARAGFIPRYLALGASEGLSQMFWYAYDNWGTGGGWGDLYVDDGGLRKPEATAWTTTYGWLLNAVPTTQGHLCQNAGTLYTCDFLAGGQTPSRMIWDSSFGPQSPLPDGGFVDGGTCDQFADPWVCGNGTYTQTTGFHTVATLSGTAPQTLPSGGVTIGGNPVLLQ